MPGKTYSTEALVLRKVNLGESDLIVRMMDEGGRLLEGVAKGARRPQGSLSGRIELFNRIRVHCASGRNLDVVKEAALLRAGERLHADPAYTSAAACVAEFAGRTIQPDLEVPRYFHLADAAFAALDAADAGRLPAIVAAYVFKASAMIGMRPRFARCVLCGEACTPQGRSRVALADGGFVCEGCAGAVESTLADANLLLWADALLMATFDDLLDERHGEAPGADLLHLAAQWSLAQADVRLKPAGPLAAYLSLL